MGSMVVISGIEVDYVGHQPTIDIESQGGTDEPDIRTVTVTAGERNDGALMEPLAIRAEVHTLRALCIEILSACESPHLPVKMRQLAPLEASVFGAESKS